VASVVFALGCGDSDAGADGLAFDPTSAGEGSGQNGGGAGGRDDSGNEGPVEFETLRLTDPVATLNYVFVANRESGLVSRFGATEASLRVTSTRSGRAPTALFAVPGVDSVVVLNRGDDSISRIDAIPGSVTGDRVQAIGIVPGANRLVVDSAGQWAAAWYDARVPTDDRPVRTVLGSLSEVSVVDLRSETLTVVQISTGVNVREIVFDGERERVLFVTDEGLASMDWASLAGDGFARPAPITEQARDAALGYGQEFLYDAERGIALLRLQGSRSLFVLDTTSGDGAEWTFDSVPADIDLTLDGRVAVTLRETDEAAGQLALLSPTALLAGDESSLETISIEEHAVGQVELSPDGRWALVFGTDGSRRSNELVSVIDLESGARNVLNVRKRVGYAVVSSDSGHAVLVHPDSERTGGEGAEDVIAGSPAVTLVDLADGRTKLVTLNGTPSEVIFSSEGAYAWVTTTGATPSEQTLLRLTTDSFRADTLRLGAAPLDIGWVARSGRVFVLQEHPYGRLTLVDEITLTLRELTGFELAALIE
jgi:DNA-binding beta-propeller fold protein YncE